MTTREIFTIFKIGLNQFRVYLQKVSNKIRKEKEKTKEKE
jgi:hypothetical protein